MASAALSARGWGSVIAVPDDGREGAKHTYRHVRSRDGLDGTRANQRPPPPAPPGWNTWMRILISPPNWTQVNAVDLASRKDTAPRPPRQAPCFRERVRRGRPPAG